jgi:deazaflavin-dependent oxidoreductase (nitroreductase family)
VSIPQGAGRTTKYRRLRVLLRGGNGVLRWALHRRMAPNAFALLETTGRRTGLPRHTPVGNGLKGDTFWLIAAHGSQADFVRNIAQEPRVRVLVNRRWRSGRAVLMPTDDTRQRSRQLASQADAAIGRVLATTPMTIRIDLDPATSDAGQASPGGRY